MNIGYCLTGCAERGPSEHDHKAANVFMNSLVSDLRRLEEASNMAHGYVLKVTNSLDSEKLPLVEGQIEIALYLGKFPHVIC